MVSRKQSLIIKGLISLTTSLVAVTMLGNFSFRSRNKVSDKSANHSSERKDRVFRPIALISMIVPTDLLLLEQPPKNNTVDTLQHFIRMQYRQPILTDPPISIPESPGEMGEPVNLVNITTEEKKLMRESWIKYGFNEYVSDMISVHRSLPDPRDRTCTYLDYPVDKLPSTSIIICFHNEAWSTLVRTVHSVLDRSPSRLITEVLLIDDHSTFHDLRTRLTKYMVNLLKVRIIRTKKREGLVRARLIGAEKALGPVLTFLDSHSECTDGWLEPLLYRILEGKKNVVFPVIDTIDALTFEYKYSQIMQVGGFSWDLKFTWQQMPQRINEKRKEASEPIESPTMPGGIFSIDKTYFERLGSYDKAYEIWGTENLELSFKTWMCGGRIEAIPCSRVGHVFFQSVYDWPDGTQVMRKNSARLAKVWMDDYAKYFYERFGNNTLQFDVDSEDLRKRIALRDKMNCKSFEWYMENICSEMFNPGQAIARGEVRNLAPTESPRCLDSGTSKRYFTKSVQVHRCHGGGGHQYWLMNSDGEIRRDEGCLDFALTGVIVFGCHGKKGNQYWFYQNETNNIVHVSSGLCIEMTKDFKGVAMKRCSDEPRQKWEFQFYEPIHTVMNNTSFNVSSPHP